MFVVVSAALVAAAMAYGSAPKSFPETLIRVQVAQQLGKIDKRIADEPLAVQALLLDYADDDVRTDVKNGRGELVLKAWVALMKYPAQSREVLQLYGAEPGFQAVLREYGESVIPVIKYFLDHDLFSVKVMNKADEVVTATTHKVGGALAQARKSIGDVWDKVRGNPLPLAPASPPLVPGAPASVKVEFGATQRGWYAINAIHSEGHKFLGQFALDTANVAHWSQVDRAGATVANFLMGGVSSLERKYELNETIGGGDVFFATLDVIPFVVAVKLLKTGKVVTAAGKELTLVGETRVFAPRLIPKNPLLVSMGKFGVVLATGYVVAKNPSVLNSAFVKIGELAGINPAVAIFLGWFLLISIALNPFFGVLKILANLILFGLSWLNKSMKKTPASAAAKPLSASHA